MFAASAPDVVVVAVVVVSVVFAWVLPAAVELAVDVGGILAELVRLGVVVVGAARTELVLDPAVVVLAGLDRMTSHGARAYKSLDIGVVVVVSVP